MPVSIAATALAPRFDALDQLREMVRRIESGDWAVVNMQLSVDASGSEEMRSINGRSLHVKTGRDTVRVEILLSACSPSLASPSPPPLAPSPAYEAWKPVRDQFVSEGEMVPSAVDDAMLDSMGLGDRPDNEEEIAPRSPYTRDLIFD